MCSMKAVQISRQGEPVAANVILNDTCPSPEPAPGELRVRTEASALNQLDLWVGRGVPGFDVQYPAISGSDGVGLVDAVGEGVSDDWLGRRVILNAAVIESSSPLPDDMEPAPGTHMIGEHGPGTMAEFFVAPVENVCDIGDVDPVEAAAFGLVHLTAWRMLVTRARLRHGSTVLIPGIGGGVALALLGIAKWHGCRVIVTSRNQAKLDRAIELGADEGILDDGADFSKTVRGMTYRRGVDVCADSVGKAVHTSCLKSLARGGVFVTCGCTSGPRAETDLARIFWNQLTVIGSTMGDMREFREVLSLLRSGALRPTIDSIHASSDGAAAFARLESGAQFGKIVIDWR